ncbi:MAG: chitobiase/beta-hexosaminidase C-terminal domain-containing protein, partial [Oscillospiraceae bacterium]|nr:chitobiase/beta-hexosaminidase C-terminal domain-containing protein [Oscillospiraceae bacterium]
MKKYRFTAALLAMTMVLTACDGASDTSASSVSSADGSSQAPENSSSADDIPAPEDTSAPSDTTSAVDTSAPEDTPVPEGTLVPEEEKEALPPSVELSHGGGIYPEEFQLTLTGLEQGEIYYTTDGSDPAKSETAQLYTAPLAVSDRSGDKNIASAVS